CILLIAGYLQAIAAGDLMHIPAAGTQMTELEKGFTHENRANTFKLIAGGLPRDTLTNGFGLEQFGNAPGNRLARRVAAVSIAYHPCAVDGQSCFKQRGMERLTGLREQGRRRHHATLKMRLTDSAAKIRWATAAATGGGKALPI